MRTGRGAILCTLAAFAFALLPSCKRTQSPDWSKSAEVSASAAGESANSEEAVASPEKSTQEIANTSDRKTTPSSTDSGFRFAAYNVRNWLVMDRYIDRKLHRSTPKPDEEKAAVIRLLAAHKPDVIGLCEIGTPADLDEIREMLHEAGLNLPHTHYTSGSDAVRRLGLLSRFPIVSSAKPEQTEFRLDGRPYSIGRGILDASIEAHGKSYRFLGVHLKSKRPVPEVDQEQIRIHEARLLRRHVDSILADDPDARLVVYGDFNDTRPTSTVKTITGNYNSPNYLTALPAKDSQGDAWTHHWVPHDIYSRIDFVTVSRVLRSELDFQNSYIIDDDGWDTGSDHRAILAIFR